MSIKGIYMLFKVLLLVSAAFNSNSPKNSSESLANAAFVRIKSLAGDWQSVGVKGEHSRLTYQVVSGGTAVMERFSSDGLPASSGEMIAIYYLDKGDLVLTHHCIAHNQPHLQATGYDSQSGELDFEFVDGGSIATGSEGHMHSAKLRFIDNDHISSEWLYIEARSPKFTELARFTRVK